MNKHLFGPVDSIDACFFSSDLLHDPVERAEMQSYLDRWQKEMDKLNYHCPSCGGSLVAGEFGTDTGLIARRYSCGAVVSTSGEFQIECPEDVE